MVDGAGYLGCALMGSNLAKYGSNNGWSGAIILGVVRDVSPLSTLDSAVKSIGLESKKKREAWNGTYRHHRFIWRRELRARALALQRRRWDPRFESRAAGSGIRLFTVATLLSCLLALFEEASKLAHHSPRERLDVAAVEKLVSCILNYDKPGRSRDSIQR